MVKTLAIVAAALALSALPAASFAAASYSTKPPVVKPDPCKGLTGVKANLCRYNYAAYVKKYPVSP